MATVIIPDVDDLTLRHARAHAEAQGRSLEADLRAVIEQRSLAGKAARRVWAEEAMAKMREVAERLEREFGPFPDSTEMLRQDREAW